MTGQEQFWASYYGEVARKGDPWLDYSNDRVQAQTFGLALEAAGPVRAKRCVDVGCGWGDFSRSLADLRAASVIGIDIVQEVIARQRLAYPHVEWLCGSVQNPDVARRLGSYDIAFLIEVLQYVPLPDVLDTIWERLRPGGRIVVVAPNANCPIVGRTRARFDLQYAPPTLEQILTVARGWTDVELLAFRGLFFAFDQRVTPYEVTRWQTSGGWNDEPNRIQFVALKRSGA